MVESKDKIRSGRSGSTSSSKDDKKDQAKRKLSDSGSTADKKMKIDRSSTKSEKSTEKPVIGKLARQKAAEAKAAEEKSQTKKKAPKKEKDNKFPKFQENKLLAEEKMTLEKISESYSVIVKTIKDHMIDITDLKNAKTEDTDSLYQTRTEAVIAISTLKQLNRFAQMLTKESRDETKAILGRSDGVNLKLQNLQYQTHHLKSEIDACLGFNSLHKEMVMVPEETFKKAAPQDIVDKAVSCDHEMVKARLGWELAQREELKSAVEEVKAERSKIENDASRVRSNLNDLRPQLSTMLEAANGVRTILGLDGTVGAMGTAREVLTDPLLKIYKAGRALSQTRSDVKVLMEGDHKEAIELKAKGFEDGEIEQEEEEEENQSKRSRKKSSKDKKDKSTKGWYPVFITWKIGNKPIKFKQNIYNKLIFAESSESSATPELSCLFNDDTGRQTSNDKSDAVKTSFGRSYKWAEQIATGEAPSNEETYSEYLEKIVEAINSRFKHSELVDEHVKSLKDKKLPFHLSELMMTGVITKFEESDIYESPRGLKPYEDGKIFKVSIQHIDEKKMYAYISISPNYPHNAPRISVFTENDKNAANDVQLQYIEEHCNLRLPIRLRAKDKMIEAISRQIGTLMMQPISAKVTTRNRFHPVQLL
ncbi:unnamed protein product [Oikopleura dioica]|uniref:Uncharacterized protein n=1 Tax=Oikopleura dioica TaxID=34765 RepID=E4WUM3_OIKDI|nr:unnamed protein product [Oikopleura dioica]